METGGGSQLQTSQSFDESKLCPSFLKSAIVLAKKSRSINEKGEVF